jgi:hypothetical protein
MRKTFCDSCGTQCVNVTIHLNGAVIHTTNKGEQAGYDELSPVELCKDCFEPIQKQFGMVARPGEYAQDSMAMARPVPPPLTADSP